ncbi:MAG: transporter substrate-binding domain-containing protein [Alkalispirochaeta sp.]
MRITSISRKRHNIVVVGALFLLAVGTQPSPAQSALDWTDEQWRTYETYPEIQVATDSTWPPMEYINRDRELVGFDIDLLREIGRRGGFRPVFETVSWDGIFAGLAARQYDMIASSVTLLEERKRAMLFSEPYFEAAQYIVVRNEDVGIQELDELAGRAVGAQIATTGSRLVAEIPDVELRTYDDLGLAVEDLATGRLAAVVADVAIVEFFVLRNERYADQLSITGPPYAVEDYAFAIRLDREELRDTINAALAEIRRDGTLSDIRDFWFERVFR